MENPEAIFFTENPTNMSQNIMISESVFSEEFQDVDSQGIVLLAKDDALSTWQKYIDENAASYFGLSDDNWLIKSSQTILGQWIKASNDNYIQEVAKLLNSATSWDDEDSIWFCISKYLIVETPWGVFKKTWITFLECEDDCPIILNRRSNGCALIFSSIGNVIKISI